MTQWLKNDQQWIAAYNDAPCRAKAEKAAAAEAAHIGTDMETNIEEAEHFTLPSGQEAEVKGRGPPDLALVSRRIKETARLLETFKVSLDMLLPHPFVRQYRASFGLLSDNTCQFRPFVIQYMPVSSPMIGTAARLWDLTRCE